MKLPKVILFCIPLFLLIAISSCSDEPEAVVAEFIENYNDHDINEMLAVMHEDIEIELAGEWIRLTKPEVKELLLWKAAANSKIVIDDILAEMDDNIIVVDGTEWNDWYDLIGVGGVDYVAILFTIVDDLISKIEFKMPEDKRMQIRFFETGFNKWLRDNSPEDFASLIVDNQYLYNKKTYPVLVTLVREWRTEKDLPADTILQIDTVKVERVIVDTVEADTL